MMAVSPPVAGLNVDLDVSGDRWIVADLDHSLLEIGARAMVPKSGVQDSQRVTGGCNQTVAFDSLVPPDSLEQVFVGKRFFLSILKKRFRAALITPAPVKRGWKRRHLVVAFALRVLQSQDFLGVLACGGVRRAV